MHRTNIEWTDFASNPLQYRDKAGKVVWGCVKHSAGCAHCYAESTALRFGRGGPFTAATMRDLTPFLDPKELNHILVAKTVDKRPAAGSRCFIGDMTDVFGEWVPDDLLDQLFGVLAIRHDVTFQVLTKRAERMANYLSAPDLGTRLLLKNTARQYTDDAASERGADYELNHVHFGVSVENQEAADERIPHLLRAPAAVRFLSCEPLLGPVDLHGDSWFFPFGTHSPIHWVIVGGESGKVARPFSINWARSLVQQCKAASVPVFVKQLGSVVAWDGMQGGYGDGPSNVWPLDTGSVQDARVPGGFRKHLVNRKGSTTSEWPEDLRVREFPKAKGGA